MLQGMGEIEGCLHLAWVVACYLQLERILKVDDEEADLVLFTSDADA